MLHLSFLALPCALSLPLNLTGLPTHADLAAPLAMDLRLNALNLRLESALPSHLDALTHASHALSPELHLDCELLPLTHAAHLCLNHSTLPLPIHALLSLDLPLSLPLA